MGTSPKQLPQIPIPSQNQQGDDDDDMELDDNTKNTFNQLAREASEIITSWDTEDDDEMGDSIADQELAFMQKYEERKKQKGFIGTVVAKTNIDKDYAKRTYVENKEHQKKVDISEEFSKKKLKIRNAKTTAGITKGVVGVGLTTTTAVNTYALGGSALGQTGWAAVVGGATLSGGAITLLVASIVQQITSVTLNVRSAYKTSRHLKALEEIKLNAGKYKCKRDQSDHKYIVDSVLPYIIAQKKKKKTRKIVGSVPILGSTPMAARRAIKGTYKFIRGTRGKARSKQAEVLSKHHRDGGCELTTAIIAELFDLTTEKAKLLRFVDQPTLAKFLSVKMRSV